MREAEVVEIGGGNPVECSRRILSAIGGGSLRTLKGELARASRVCAAPHRSASTLGEEQAELLGAIVERMRLPPSEYEPFAETEIYLLGHLAETHQFLQLSK
jgi:hypothetical protein